MRIELTTTGWKPIVLPLAPHSHGQGTAIKQCITPDIEQVIGFEPMNIRFADDSFRPLRHTCIKKPTCQITINVCKLH